MKILDTIFPGRLILLENPRFICNWRAYDLQCHLVQMAILGHDVFKITLLYSTLIPKIDLDIYQKIGFTLAFLLKNLIFSSFYN